MKIALIGDSHTQIVWPVLTPILEQQGHTITTTQANAGWSAKKYMSTGMVDKVNEGDPDAVIVGLGGNNHDLSDKYGETISQFLDKVGRNRRVVWIGAYTSDIKKAESTAKRHEWTSDYLAKILPKQNVVFIDTRPISQTGHRGDGVHFTRDEYKRMVNQMTPDILSGLTDTGMVRYMKKSLPLIMIISSVVGLGIWAYIKLQDKRHRR
tara:strand:+ start:483 stop:1109 length:627 start_codon:yes stop_codon:yes gene_type:complete